GRTLQFFERPGAAPHSFGARGFCFVGSLAWFILPVLLVVVALSWNVVGERERTFICLGVAATAAATWKNAARLMAYAFREPEPDLINAVARGDVTAAQALLDSGANVDAKAVDSRTALHVAVANGHKEIVELLFGRNADPEIRNDDGKTLLHEAAAFGNKEVAEYLLERGADIQATDSAGRTPLSLAKSYGRKDLVELLTQRGGPEQAEDSPVPQGPEGQFTTLKLLPREAATDTEALRGLGDPALCELWASTWRFWKTGKLNERTTRAANNTPLRTFVDGRMEKYGSLFQLLAKQRQFEENEFVLCVVRHPGTDVIVATSKALYLLPEEDLTRGPAVVILMRDLKRYHVTRWGGRMTLELRSGETIERKVSAFPEVEIVNRFLGN
ncbi:MAG: ankyrin repeat domain-containing protein, partial [Terracidiphilus sp.]